MRPPALMALPGDLLFLGGVLKLLVPVFDRLRLPLVVGPAQHLQTPTSVLTYPVVASGLAAHPGLQGWFWQSQQPRSSETWLVHEAEMVLRGKCPKDTWRELEVALYRSPSTKVPSKGTRPEWRNWQTH
jgi:hypothetical protein